MIDSRTFRCAVFVALIALSFNIGTVAGASGDSAGDAAHDPHTEQATNENMLSLDVDLAIVTAIVFLLLLAVLGKFAWTPICEMLDQREKQVADNLANAERQNEEARKLLQEHEEKLASTANEVRQMIETAKKDAESQKQTILAEAQEAAAGEKDRAIREIDAAKTAALQSMAEKSVDSAVDLAARIVKRQLSRDDHSEMISDTLNQFPSKN